METKKCKRCQIFLPLFSFTQHKKTKDGLQSNCIDCGKEIKKEWRIKNKTRSDTYFEAYRKNNKDIIKATQKKYRKKYPEKEKLKSHNYKKNNPQKACQWYHTRRAKLLGSLHPLHDKKFEEALHVVRLRLSKCLGIYFHVDHILPLDKGGYHHHGNLQVIPGKLNESKNNNINFIHPSLTHWTELPNFLIDNVKLVDSLEQSPE